MDVKSKHKYFIGVELSEKAITLCLTDNKVTIVTEETFLLNPSNQIEVLNTEGIAQLIKDFIYKHNNYHISSIGIALPGHYSTTKNSLLTNNPLWNGINLDYLQEKFKRPMYFENNVKSMVVYKRLFREETNDENFILHHISRGIFCAYMYNGKLYAEKNRLIGEVGHTTIEMDGELCECGNHGCLQTFASEAWIIKKAKIIFNNIQSTHLRNLVQDVDDIDFNTILIAYQLGDPNIISLLHSAVQAIATSIINLSMIIDSETIYVHGQIYEEPALVQKLNEILKNRKLLFTNDRPFNFEVFPYDIMNGAIGAAALCIAETYTKSS